MGVRKPEDEQRNGRIVIRDSRKTGCLLRKVGNGSWTPYVIGRDYLGSITHIATADGTLVEERSYDAQ